MLRIEQKVKSLLRLAAQRGASDLHLVVGRYPTYRIDGRLYPYDQDEILTPDGVEDICSVILDDAERKMLKTEGQVDLSYNFEDKVRFRVNAFTQRGHTSIAFRLISSEIKTLEQLGLPTSLYDFANASQGLFLMVGPVGHGKSTTLAALIDYINHNKEKHILTIEDPIEYIYEQDRSIINQREVYQDTVSFQAALKALFREDANVVLIGEMRDLDTISAAMTAAETGHLIFGTLHTNDAAQTIDRIVDVFPSHQQNQIRSQLASVLLAVVSQRLIARVDGGRVPAIEVMIKNHAVENLIRENKSYQLDNVIETSSQEGMISMDRSLLDLVRQGIVSIESALAYANDSDNFRALLKY